VERGKFSRADIGIRPQRRGRMTTIEFKKILLTFIMFPVGTLGNNFFFPCTELLVFNRMVQDVSWDCSFAPTKKVRKKQE
jgi:hypothetical protein